MPNVRIVTDTISCVPAQMAREYQIKVIPAALISYDGHQYLEGVTLSATEAYELIAKDPDRFVTAPLTPANMIAAMGKLPEVQDILLITVSAALSAVNKVAHLMADLQREKSPGINIRVFDSASCGAGEGLVALAAAKGAKAGMSLDQVEKVAEAAKKATRSIMILDTLRYIYRTGRMTREQAQQAADANIKPINRVARDGTIEFVDMVTDREAGYDKIIKIIQAEAEAKALHFMVNHAAAPEMAERISALLKQNFDCLSLIVSDYSPVMGYGAGPGAIFIGYHPEIELLK